MTDNKKIKYIIIPVKKFRETKNNLILNLIMNMKKIKKAMITNNKIKK